MTILSEYQFHGMPHIRADISASHLKTCIAGAAAVTTRGEQEAGQELRNCVAAARDTRTSHV